MKFLNLRTLVFTVFVYFTFSIISFSQIGFTQDLQQLPAATTATEVKGFNVTRVEFSRSADGAIAGVFRQVGDKTWIEGDHANPNAFQFNEVNRDIWSVYLHDASRNTSIQLDLWTKKIMIGTNPKQELYTIRSAISETKGFNVTRVEHTHGVGGFFQQTGEKTWVEGGPGNPSAFQFNEINQDEWSVYLHDASRNVSIQLDLWTKKIMIGSNPRQELYTIQESSTAHVLPSSAARTFDQYTWLTTHNSFTNYEDARWSMANQSHSVIHQLNNGVRGLMLDVHPFEGTGDFRGGFTCGISLGADCYAPGLYLCHDPCGTAAGFTYALPRQNFTDTLQDIGLWLFDNTDKDDVITIFLEDYASPAALESAIKNAPAATQFVYNPSTDPDWKVKDKGWPTLEWMQKNNKRLILMTNTSTNTNQWVVYQRAFNVENFWSLGDLGDNYECTAKWAELPLDKAETGWNRLFVMNQFRNVPTTFTAAIDNSLDNLNRRWEDYCEPAAGRLPNFLAVDFYEIGSGDVFVESMNQEWSELSGNIADPNPVIGPNANRPDRSRFYDSKRKVEVSLDCHHDDLTGTHTNARITVEFWAGDMHLISKYRDGIGDCRLSEKDFSTTTTHKITHIIMSTNGGDGFYIDEFRVKSDGDQILWEGRDNGRGWCLSTDASDSRGDWRDYVSSGGCQSSFRFAIP